MSKSLSKRQFYLLLSLIPHLGSKSIEKILRINQLESITPDEFLSLGATELTSKYKLRSEAIFALSLGLSEYFDKLEELENRIRTNRLEVLTIQEAGYPYGVEEYMRNAPALIFAYGNMALMEGETFCALASRKTTPIGLKKLEEIVEKGVFARKTLVSGHNNLGYQRASITALRWGAPRILVLDCGLFQGLGEKLENEPFRIARLYRYRFDPKTDLVLSPFRLNDPYIGSNNTLRDDLIAAISEIVVVVEISEGGTMRKRALRAKEMGRKVGVVKYESWSDMNEGNRLLLEMGIDEFTGF